MLAGWVCWRRIGGPGGASSSLDAQRSTTSAMALLWFLQCEGAFEETRRAGPGKASYATDF